MGAVIALAGQVGVGKTSVAQELELLGFEVRSFGEVIRGEAVRNGHHTPDRSVLQATGQTLLASLGPNGLADRLLDAPFDRLVIDGVRHSAVLAHLSQRLPRLVSVLLTASPAVLDMRWAARGDSDRRDDVARHPVEREIESLRADVTLTIRTDDLLPRELALIVSAAT